MQLHVVGMCLVCTSHHPPRIAYRAGLIAAVCPPNAEVSRQCCWLVRTSGVISFVQKYVLKYIQRKPLPVLYGALLRYGVPVTAAITSADKATYLVMSLAKLVGNCRATKASTCLHGGDTLRNVGGPSQFTRQVRVDLASTINLDPASARSFDFLKHVRNLHSMLPPISMCCSVPPSSTAAAAAACSCSAQHSAIAEL